MADVATGPLPGALRDDPPGDPHGVVEARIPSTIVPLPLVGAALVVFAVLIVAIAVDNLWMLEFFHVVFGAFWTIFDLFFGFVVGPIMGTMSIPARVELSRRLMPKIAVLVPTAVACTLAAGWKIGTHLGTVDSTYYNHGWIVASYIVVGVMGIIALGVMEPANISVLFELRKPRPNGEVIARLMKRFLYTVGIIGAAQVATLVIMVKVASG